MDILADEQFAACSKQHHQLLHGPHYLGPGGDTDDGEVGGEDRLLRGGVGGLIDVLRGLGVEILSTEAYLYALFGIGGPVVPLHGVDAVEL